MTTMNMNLSETKPIAIVLAQLEYKSKPQFYFSVLPTRLNWKLKASQIVFMPEHRALEKRKMNKATR